MRRNGFTDAASAQTSETAAIKSMLDGRVAMVFADAGFEAIRMTYKPAFTAWGLFDAPEDSRARFLARLPGGVVEGLVINAHGQQKTQAIAFAKWLTEPSQQVALANGSSSLPATPNAGRGLSAHLRAFASVGMPDQAIDMRIYENPRVLATFYSGVRGILADSETPSAAAHQTQLVKAAH
jgi:ABC-type glycerol-3-phosphate transport system substrate-binding protein